MPDPTSINQIDLTPAAGKVYSDLHRDWREEVIYFLMTDRFHDSATRQPRLQAARSQGFATADTFYGGTLRGIVNHLDYIAGLGCTALWLSPILENNPNAYHGYDINNYLSIDPHFGTRQDLIDLVDAAHHFRIGNRPRTGHTPAITHTSITTSSGSDLAAGGVRTGRSQLSCRTPSSTIDAGRSETMMPTRKCSTATSRASRTTPTTTMTRARR